MNLIYVGAYALACLIVAYYGRKSRLGFLGLLLLTPFLTPLIVFVGLLLLSPPHSATQTRDSAK
jgi:hypothetical protein